MHLQRPFWVLLVFFGLFFGLDGYILATVKGTKLKERIHSSMWVFTLDGFFSVVQKGWDKDTDTVQVRGRNRVDLERFVQRMNLQDKVIETPKADYPFRVVTTRQVWGKYLDKMASMIAYENFKHEVEVQDGASRADIYLRVWSELRKLEKSGKGLVSKKA
jgi:hypothetical protein